MYSLIYLGQVIKHLAVKVAWGFAGKEVVKQKMMRVGKQIILGQS